MNSVVIWNPEPAMHQVYRENLLRRVNGKMILKGNFVVIRPDAKIEDLITMNEMLDLSREELQELIRMTRELENLERRKEIRDKNEKILKKIRRGK